MKICSNCRDLKSLKEFQLEPKGKDGHRSQCRKCKSKYKRKYDALHREFNKLQWKKYYQQNRVWLLSQTKNKRKAHPEKSREACAKWARNNPHKVQAIAASKRASRRSATPSWVNKKKLLEFYENCPPGLTVDHIIPLTNKFVCGLHVPWNLQYLKPFENSQKKNKFDFTYHNESWRNGKTPL